MTTEAMELYCYATGTFPKMLSSLTEIDDIKFAVKEIAMRYWREYCSNNVSMTDIFSDADRREVVNKILEDKGMMDIETMKVARETAGFREKYALQNGELEVKENLWIFRYSPDDPYQDANGATFDTNRMEWVG